MENSMGKVNIFWQMAIGNLAFGTMVNDNLGSLKHQTRQVIIKLGVINSIAKVSYNHETSI